MNYPVLLTLIIPLAFAVHELEEWNILDWYKKHYTGLPGSTNTSIRIWIVFVSLVMALLTVAATLLIKVTLLFSPLIVFISAFMLVNIVQHIIWTVQYRDYSPGLATALLLLAVLIPVHLYLGTKGIINPWFYLIVLYGIVPVIRTIKSPGTMTSEIRGAHRLGLALENLVFRRHKP